MHAERLSSTDLGLQQLPAAVPRPAGSLSRPATGGGSRCAQRPRPITSPRGREGSTGSSRPFGFTGRPGSWSAGRTAPDLPAAEVLTSAADASVRSPVASGSDGSRSADAECRPPCLCTTAFGADADLLVPAAPVLRQRHLLVNRRRMPQAIAIIEGFSGRKCRKGPGREVRPRIRFVRSR